MHINKIEDKNEAIVELTITVGNDDNLNPFYIKAIESAKFKWSDSTKINEDKLLEQNAPALLIGYLRPIISIITASFPFSAYNLPFIDFTT